MENANYNHPTPAQMDAYVAKGRQLRARAMRQGTIAAAEFVKSGFRMVLKIVARQYQAWNRVDIAATPSQNS